MTFSNKSTANFSGGEVAPEITARIDLPIFNKVLQWMQNFIAQPQGPAEYRPGFKYAHHTRNNNNAVYIPFQFSDSQAYLIEASAGYFRFFKDEGIILNSTTQAITGATKANPCVITAAGHGYSNGDEVHITGVVGMTELNGKFYTVANKATNTFELTDVFSANVDSTAFTTYISGGTAANVFEVKTPYADADLATLKYDQNADTMYVMGRKYAPRKLTRSAHDNWTLARYARTNDQFETDNVTFGVVTGISQASPGVISDAGHTFVVDDIVYVSGVVGMTEVNDSRYKINSIVAATSYTLKDEATGTAIDTSGFTAYASGGIVEKIGATTYPGSVSFTDDSRTGMSGSTASPETMWYSRSPNPSGGALRLDDYTTGTSDDHAIFFTLAPLQGRVDSVLWMSNTDKYIAVGTFGSIRRVFGSTEAASITPTSVSAKPANSDGVLNTPPVIDGAVLFYINRTGLIIETLEYDFQIDGYSPDDKNLVSQHILVGGARQMKLQRGRPTIIWVVRNDGVLLGLTHKPKENIAGWHRHILGGKGSVESIGIMLRPAKHDQLWAIVKRTINGNTVRYHEYMADPVNFPSEIESFTGEANETANRRAYLDHMSELMKNSIHVDSSLTYDGSSIGTGASATLMIGAGGDVEETASVNLTASAAVFTSDMVGRELWGKYASDGTGGGRAEITAFTSTTVVVCTILDPFPALRVFAAGDWFLTATSISGLDHLEGATVKAVTDGAVPDDKTVTNGAISFTQAASVVHVGLGYTGILQTLPLEQGGVSGPAQSKLKNITKVAVRFINSVGTKFGSSLYSLTNIDFQFGNTITDRPPVLFNGVDENVYEDDWDENKSLCILQDTPMPCTISSLDIYAETTDE